MTTTPVKCNAVEELTEVIDTLLAVRELLVKSGEALDGWRMCKDPMLSRLLQFHRPCHTDDPEPVDAKVIARAIGTEWKRIGNKLESVLKGFPDIEVCLHDAESGRPDPDLVKI